VPGECRIAQTCREGCYPSSVNVRLHRLVLVQLADYLQPSRSCKIINKVRERTSANNQHVHLALLSRDEGIAGNEFGENATSGLDAEGEWANIEKGKVFGAFGARQYTTLDGGTIGNGFIRVNSLGRLLSAEEFFKKLLYFGNASRAANKDNLWKRNLAPSLVLYFNNIPHRCLPF
jgi:hypothetical protein